MINKKLFSREKGQGLVEYALILVLVAIVVIAVLLLLGPALNQAFCKVANTLKPGTCNNSDITVTGGPTVTDTSGVGTGPYRLTMTVKLAQAVNGVTVSAGGQTSSPANCNLTCSFTVNGVAASGSYIISAGSLGSTSGTYP